MNHIEGQWTAIKADADAHNHDTRYYPKATSDTTFFSTSYYSGFDADLLDGQHLSDIVSAIMPIGAILVWSGTDANIPNGWSICNGGSGTPDLRDKFIIGSGGAYSIGDTGGTFTKSLTGSIAVDGHPLTNDEMPLHTHGYNDIYNDIVQTANTIPNSYPPTGTLNNTTRTTGSSGGGGAHGHAGSTISLTDINAVPSYYALYYIQRVS